MRPEWRDMHAYARVFGIPAEWGLMRRCGERALELAPAGQNLPRKAGNQHKFPTMRLLCAPCVCGPRVFATPNEWPKYEWPFLGRLPSVGALPCRGHGRWRSRQYMPGTRAPSTGYLYQHNNGRRHPAAAAAGADNPMLLSDATARRDEGFPDQGFGAGRNSARPAVPG